MLVTFKSTSAEAEAVLGSMHDSRPLNPIIEVVYQPTIVVGAMAIQQLPKPYQLQLAMGTVWLGNDVDVPTNTEKIMLNLPTSASVAVWTPFYPAPRRSMNRSILATTAVSDHYFAVYLGWDKEGNEEKHSIGLREHMLDIESTVKVAT
jgi:hypothetical protein